VLLFTRISMKFIKGENMHSNFSEETIEEVRNANDIVQVVSEYVKLEKKGRNFFGLCPFHSEKTPSFSVAPGKQIYYCFGCGKGGNVVHFIMEIEKVEFVDAIRQLAERARISLSEGNDVEEIKKEKRRKGIIKLNTEAAKYFFANLQKAPNKGMDFVKKRGLSPQIIKRFGLGYSSDEWDALYKYLIAKGFAEDDIQESGMILTNKKGGYYDRFRGRFIFPIFDVAGKVIAFGGRVLDDSMPKYMNSPEHLGFSKSRNLYGLNFAKKSGGKQLIIVEGYMDVISLHQFGITNVVASLGTALTEGQGRLLKRYCEEVVIAYDADTAGQAATMRGMDILDNIGCPLKILRVPAGKDPDEYIRAQGVESFSKLIKHADSLVDYKISSLRMQIKTESVESKIMFLNKVADILSKVGNLVEREMYVKKICEEYRITNEALNTEIFKRTKPKGTYRKRKDISEEKFEKELKNDNDDKLIKTEKLLLAFLCVDNSTYKIVERRIKCEDFTDDINKNAAKYVFGRLSANKDVFPADLLEKVDSSSIQEYAAIFEKNCEFEDSIKAVEDILSTIENIKLDSRKNSILDMLAGKVPMDNDVQVLMKELKELISKKQNI